MGTITHGSGRRGWRSSRIGAPKSAREVLYAELDVLRRLRPPAKAVMVAEPRRDPAWAVVEPFFGPVRVALLLAPMQTPWRFRTKRHLWASAGLAVVTRSSAEYAILAGRPLRHRPAPLTRGLDRNHNRVPRDLFTGAATTATARPGPKHQQASPSADAADCSGKDRHATSGDEVSP
jgi:hypothetical protein